MDENHWLTGAWPKWMLEHIRPRASPRKLRLFACASVRRIETLPEPAGPHALQTAEEFAQGLRSQADAALAAAAALARRAPPHDVQRGHTIGEIRTALERLVANTPWEAAHAYVSLVSRWANNPHDRQVELTAQADILRCLFGNPFRPVSLDPAWLVNNGGAANHLARAIDEEQRFADLPILADALEEAGCDHAPLLDHCRSAGPHFRGCWALDLLLGRS